MPVVAHPMPLSQALRVLRDIHTRADDVTGFVVLVGAKPEPYNRHSEFEVFQAWQTVRAALGSGELDRPRVGRRPWWCPRWLRRVVIGKVTP